MSIKKILIPVSIISIALIIFVIWYELSIKESLQAMSVPRQRFKVYLITTDKEYEYWEQVNEGAKDMANLAGVNYIWEAPAERNTQLQIEVVKEAVNDGADAILIAVNDPVKLTSTIEDAKARGVRIIYVDSPANVEAVVTLATNNLIAATYFHQQSVLPLNYWCDTGVSYYNGQRKWLSRGDRKGW